MKTLVLGAGNLLLSDEGFGVHFIRHLQENYSFPHDIEFFDAGTLGLMLMHKIEEAERVYIIDTLSTAGAPGQIFRYTKQEFMLNRLPLKLSPHQAGIQEMLFVSEMRGCCPENIFLLGIVPASVQPGIELSPVLQERLPELARQLVNELEQSIF